MLAIALALCAALTFGAADFLGGVASRRTSAFAVLIWSQAASFGVLAVLLPLLPGTLHASDLAWGAIGGMIGAAAIGLLYRALAIGTMGVVSPLTAVLSAMLPIAYGLARGEYPSRLAWIGIACALVAVVAIAWEPPEPSGKARRGIAEAVGSGVLIGVFFIALAHTHGDAGLYPLVAARTASFVVLMLVAAVLRVQLRPAPKAVTIIVVAGVCDIVGNALYLLAAHAGMLAIVVVLTALYPAATVALAAVFLKEQLRAVQWGGVGLALGAVAFMTAGK